MSRLLTAAWLIGLLAILAAPLDAAAQQESRRPRRAAPPARDPHTPGFVSARELPDGTVPPADADGNFIIGPTHNPAPEMTVQAGVPRGRVFDLVMRSEDSKIYPGIAREPNTFGTPDPDDPAKLVVTTSHDAPYTRKVAVYVPKQYVPGTEAPFIVGADGPDRLLFNERMAHVLAAKGYHYQFVFARNARHCDGGVKQQTLPAALEYVWQGYPITEAQDAPRGGTDSAQ